MCLLQTEGMKSFGLAHEDTRVRMTGDWESWWQLFTWKMAIKMVCVCVARNRCQRNQINLSGLKFSTTLDIMAIFCANYHYCHLIIHMQCLLSINLATFTILQRN